MIGTQLGEINVILVHDNLVLPNVDANFRMFNIIEPNSAFPNPNLSNATPHSEKWTLRLGHMF